MLEASMTDDTWYYFCVTGINITEKLLCALEDRHSPMFSSLLSIFPTIAKHHNNLDPAS